MRRYGPAVLLICVSIGLITIGILMKQPESVLHKAVRICMECVGLG
ncbi:MAG: hypothetical protein K6F83_06475 [Clostridiales bacterium]|nr:hypothetical protein [Clostridiales bacterium]